MLLYLGGWTLVAVTLVSGIIVGSVAGLAAFIWERRKKR